MPEHNTSNPVDLLWDEFKFRQSHWWSIANKFGLAIIATLLLPYVQPAILERLGRATLILPAFGLAFSLAATWILGAEYQRVRAVRAKLAALTPDDMKLDFPSVTWYERLFGRSIGHATTLIFLMGFTFLCIADAVALWFIAGSA